MNLYEYDPTEVSVIIGGTIIEGLAEGESIKVARNVDTVSLKVGTQGDATRTRSADRSGRITITTQQASPSNKILMDLLKADEASGAGVVPTLVRDNSSSNTLHAAEQSWIVRQPDDAKGAESGNFEWILETHSLRTSIVDA